MKTDNLYLYSKKRNSSVMGRLFLSYIYIIFILWSAGFGLFFVLPYFKNLYWLDSLSIFTIIVSLTYFILIFANTGVVRFGFHNSSLFWVFFFFIAISFLFSSYKYNQGLAGTIKYAAYYLIPLFSIFVYFQFPKRFRSFSAVNKAIINVSIIDSTVALVSYFLIVNADINLLNIPYSLRNGTPRFTIGVEVVLISIFISLNKCFKTKKISPKDACNIILGTLQIIIAGKTRSFLLYYAIAFVFIIALYSNFKTKICLYTVFFDLFLVFAFNAQYIINSISDYFLSDAGISIRFEAISFFMKQFYSKPFFGIGFISSKGPYSTLLGGANGKFYYDDVGVVGLLAQFGLFGLLWVIVLLATAFLQAKKTNLLISPILKTFVFYLTISSINLLFVDRGKLIYLFMLFVFTDFCHPISAIVNNTKRSPSLLARGRILNTKLKGCN